MPVKQNLDLTRIEIKPLSHETVTNRFCCGKTPIDRFFKNNSEKAEKRLEYRTFCAHLDKSPICIGYYSLQVGTGKVAELPNTRNTWLSTWDKEAPFPAIHLAYLGVHEEYQRQGLGEYLMMDVFSKVEHISEYIGLFALTLISLDDNSTAFYKSIGFTTYLESSPPKMFYPIAGVIDTVNAFKDDANVTSFPR